MRNNWALVRKSDIFSHFVSLKYLPRWLVLLVDVLTVIFSYSACSFFTTQLSIDINTVNTAFDMVFILPSFIFILVQVFYFWLYHTYSGILRYSSFVDTAKLLLAVLSNVATFLIINLASEIFFGYQIYRYSALISYGILTFFLLFIIRLIAKNAFEYFSLNSGKVTPVMIYGTQSAGIGIAKMLRVNMEANYKLVGFIDTDKETKSKILMGVRVYDLTEENVKRVISKKAKAVIVSPLKMANINPKTDLDIFINNGLAILSVPPVTVRDGAMPSPKDIKSVQIEDLLERPQITISTDDISKELRGKVVLVTGAAGSIGSEIVKQSASFNPKLIVLVDQAETPMHELMLKVKTNTSNVNFAIFLGDIRNQQRMEQMMSTFQPDIIFHAAAYKHVPLMEDNPTESVETNVKGTKIIADLAVKYEVSRFVMISTDKAVNPTNVMGASKRIAEIYVQSLNNHLISNGEVSTRFITTRFGNVLGSNGSVIPLFRRQIEHKGPVTVTHPNIIRYFMTIPEACMLVLEAGTVGEGGEIYIFDMGEPVKILDLATKMIRLAGYIPGVDISIEFTGLRPGEKLYEELLNNKEITKETQHPKIMVANVREYNYLDVSNKIDELIECSQYGKPLLCVSKMKAIVPEFKSNNSQYEKLDIDKVVIN